MGYYFSLQFKLLNRRCLEFGLQPALAYPLSLLVFVGLSFYLYERFGFAPYILLFFAFGSLSALSERERNFFLENCYSKRKYRAILLLKNTAVALPFAAIFICQSNIIPFAILLSIALMLALLRLNGNMNFYIPTPFSRQPFEFAIGFRKTIWLFPLLVFVLVQGIVVDNFNLGAFALAVVFFTSMSYYSEPEKLQYVWIFAQQPKGFIWRKIKTAMLHVSILTLPLLAVLAIFFPGYIPVLIGLQCLGYAYLAATILAKYAAFPRQISLPEGLLLGASFAFPPLLLFSIPFFLKKSIQQLNQILS
mgnify:CR=1 FL=1